MSGVIKMPTNAEKRQFREQYGIPNQNSSRAVRLLGFNSMADFYRNAQRQQAIREFQVRRAVRTIAEARQARRQARAVSAIQEGARGLLERRRIQRLGNVFTVQNIYGRPQVTHKPILRRFAGQQVMVTTTAYGDLGVKSHTVRLNIPATGFSSWFKKNWFEFMEDSDKTKIKDLSNQVGILNVPPRLVTITVNPLRYVTERAFPQLFADGVNHCMFQPILEWAFEKQDTSKSKSAKVRYSGMINKLNKYIKKYKDGIPEKDIQDVCNDLQINIKIDLPLLDTQFISCESFKKPLKTFKFVNSRLNHVELNEVIHANKYEDMGQDELNELALKLAEDGEYFDFQKDKSNNFTTIRTLSGCYKSSSDYQKAVNEFEDANNIGDYKIDIVNDRCADIIEESIVANGTIDFEKRWKLKWWGNCETEEDKKIRMAYFDKIEKMNRIKALGISDRKLPTIPDDIKHIDMKKAYVNFDKCEQYIGFMGKPTDWRYCDVGIDFIKKNIGVYRLKEIDFSEAPEKIRKINRKFKDIFREDDVYPSSDFVWMNDNGIKFKVSEGCWGTKADFRFTPSMLKKEDGVAYYSKWCGVNQKYSTTQSFNMFGDQAYFENMKVHASKECEIGMYKDGVGVIQYPKKHSFSAPHIVAFIMSYQRLTIFNQLKNMDLDKLLRICVDGIYYRDHEYIMLKNFQVKDEVKLANDCGKKYMSYNSCPMELDSRPQLPAPFREPYDKELFIGAGGNGKTHYNLTDKGFARLLYVAPSWKLARAKSLEYKINTTVMARCLDPCRKDDIKKYNNVILFDEASQISEETKEAIFELYGTCKIIFCGDLGYQLPPIEGEEMETTGFGKITEFEKNYRFTCEKHREICSLIREMMESGVSRKRINEIVVSKYENISEPKDYKPEDIILCSKHDYCDEYTKKFGETKWKCLENLRDYSNGDILITNEKPKGRWEARHGYTIHSVQGETYENTIYIDSRKMFDSRMAYTAISRARRWEQIKIIV